jgi:hypothetical protein
MSQIACCFWWLVLGFLLGWLANWLLSKMFRRNPPAATRVDEEAAERAAVAHHDAIVEAAAAPPARVIDVPAILDILERGGPHFQLANPGSWARQAALASENRWAELKRLQEELISGRPSSSF